MTVIIFLMKGKTNHEGNRTSLDVTFRLSGSVQQSNTLSCWNFYCGYDGPKFTEVIAIPGPARLRLCWQNFWALFCRSLRSWRLFLKGRWWARRTTKQVLYARLIDIKGVLERRQKVYQGLMPTYFWKESSNSYSRFARKRQSTPYFDPNWPLLLQNRCHVSAWYSRGQLLDISVWDGHFTTLWTIFGAIVTPSSFLPTLLPLLSTLCHWRQRCMS